VRKPRTSVEEWSVWKQSWNRKYWGLPKSRRRCCLFHTLWLFYKQDSNNDIGTILTHQLYIDLWGLFSRNKRDSIRLVPGLNINSRTHQNLEHYIFIGNPEMLILVYANNCTTRFLRHFFCLSLFDSWLRLKRLGHRYLLLRLIQSPYRGHCDTCSAIYRGRGNCDSYIHSLSQNENGTRQEKACLQKIYIEMQLPASKTQKARGSRWKQLYKEREPIKQ
jgi:hypothetical protein